ncbi:site-specific integrase [Donghicola sp. XS_ASV15]|uniref:site-specific integrase n=1 Tax=Donghicola sp. XS_ASV15 TaxID=3241295 RepID=UPI0035156640
MSQISHIPSTALTLSDADQQALTDLYVRGTPANTLRAYERDLIYITAWKAARFAAPLDWPEKEDVAIAFILDHARDLRNVDRSDHGRNAAAALITAKLRKSLACPAPSTLERRIASWQAFHRMKNIASPFDMPMVRQTRAKARRAAARTRAPKSEKPIVRDVLQDMLATCEGQGIRGRRDKAILLLGWASGGRRRSEIAGLMYEDLELSDFAEEGLIWIQLVGTKTTQKGRTPKLVLKGIAARGLMDWLIASDITDGPLFRPISKSGRPLARPLSADGVYEIVKKRLSLAGLPRNFASPHGLRSGFLTQAALDGTPIQAAMRLSLHRSVAQAQKYYDDIDIAVNPATDLLDKD